MVVIRPDWTTSCLNCGEPLTGRFCPQCGQRALPPHPTLRQLAGEAWAEALGAVTALVFATVPDVDAHFARAKAGEAAGDR